MMVPLLQLSGFCTALWMCCGILPDSGYAQTTSSSLFQCQPSSGSGGDGQVYTPNIPDFYFSHKNAADFRGSRGSENLTTADNGRTYIFTIPPKSAERNCSGDVVAIQYCYQARGSNINDNETIYTFLHLNRSGFEFSVTNSFTVYTIPRENNCTNPPGGIQRVCCDNAILGAPNQFKLSSTNYTFGVSLVNRNVRPLAFADSVAAYRYEQLQASIGTPLPGRMFTLHERDVESDWSLLLLRFILDPDDDDTPTEFVTTTNGAATELGSTTSTSGTTNQETPTASVSSSSRGLIGGVVGGLIVATLLVTAVVVVIVGLLVVYRRKKFLLNNGFDNANYEIDIRDGGNGPDYPGMGPSVYSEVEHTTLHSLEDDIYQVPAGNVVSLLSQICAKILPRDTIGLGSHLGSGQFGTVYKGVWVSPNGEVEVAVKTLKEASGEEDRVKFLQEAAIMGQFKHPNVVEMYGVVTQGEPVLIALELLPKGDLRRHLLGVKSGSVDAHALLSYCRQVVHGMTYLSSKAFVHRDLAARNILVSDDDICKIADFGMSRDLMDENYYVSHGGKIPVKWTAPEALHYKKYSTASDVWSYGALMYEIWSVGHKPFENITNSEALQMIGTGYRLPPPPGCPRALYTIMMSCWNSDTRARPIFSELTRQLSLPDTKLLKWSEEEDKSVHPEAAQLGADLTSANDLYIDLQAKYKPIPIQDYEEVQNSLIVLQLITAKFADATSFE